MELQALWSEFLKLVHDEAGSRVVETWFKALSLCHWDQKAKVAYVTAPNRFIKEWVYKHYYALFQTHLGRLLHVTDPVIEFVEKGASITSAVSTAVTVQPRPERASSSVAPLSKKLTGSHLNRLYTFGAFVVGPSNSLAYAAAQAVSRKPGSLYNPLFVYGGAGLGKTHLLHAVGNEIKQEHRRASILYQTTDRFVSEFIAAIRFDRVHNFKRKYQGVDVLLIDDIQFICNKEQTQEAFFHIFNSLYNAEKQIIFSSDTFPENLNGIAARLKSRMSAGMIVDIYRPSLETKIAIIKKKAASQNEPVSDEVAYFIASQVVSNVRELEGALVRLLAFASLTKQPVTIELASKVLMRMVERKQGVIDFGRISRASQDLFSVTHEQLCSKSRNKHIAFVRQVTMYVMKKMTHKSLRDIGGYLGGRDHSTVLHAIEKIESEMKKNSSLQEKIQELEELILA